MLVVENVDGFSNPGIDFWYRFLARTIFFGKSRSNRTILFSKLPYWTDFDVYSILYYGVL